MAEQKLLSPATTNIGLLLLHGGSVVLLLGTHGEVPSNGPGLRIVSSVRWHSSRMFAPDNCLNMDSPVIPRLEAREKFLLPQVAPPRSGGVRTLGMLYAIGMFGTGRSGAGEPIFRFGSHCSGDCASD